MQITSPYSFTITDSEKRDFEWFGQQEAAGKILKILERSLKLSQPFYIKKLPPACCFVSMSERNLKKGPEYSQREIGLLPVICEAHGKKYIDTLFNPPLRLETWCDDQWDSLKTNLINILRKNNLYIFEQKYEGTCYLPANFTFCTGGTDTLLVLKLSAYFQEFFPLAIERYNYLSNKIIQASGLLEQAKTQKYTDCTIKFKNGSTWGAHRGVLSYSSEVFDKMFSNQMKEERTRLIDLSTADTKTAQIFISYLYTSEDPFISSNNSDIDLQDLLSLSHMYEITPLFEHCIRNIEEHLVAEECSGATLEAIGQFGITYENEHLLKTYQFYCWHQGKLVSEKAKESFAKFGIQEYQPATTKVIVSCDVGFENTVGIRYQDPYLDPSQSELFISFSWKMTQLFKWTQEGWLGCVPNKLPFKFVKVLPNEEIIWENREGNRFMEIPKTGAPVKITDISFQ